MSVNYGRQKFYNFGPRSQCEIETRLLVDNLLITIKTWSQSSRRHEVTHFYQKLLQRKVHFGFLTTKKPATVTMTLLTLAPWAP